MKQASLLILILPLYVSCVTHESVYEQRIHDLDNKKTGNVFTLLEDLPEPERAVQQSKPKKRYKKPRAHLLIEQCAQLHTVELESIPSPSTSTAMRHSEEKQVPSITVLSQELRHRKHGNKPTHELHEPVIVQQPQEPERPVTWIQRLKGSLPFGLRSCLPLWSKTTVASFTLLACAGVSEAYTLEEVQAMMEAGVEPRM